MQIIFPRPTVIVTFLDVSVYFSALYVLIVAVLLLLLLMMMMMLLMLLLMLLLLLSEALECLAYFCVVIILRIVF